MKSNLLALLFIIVALSAVAQQKNIKVQIMHEGEVVMDTTLHMSSSEAKIVIENLVEQFSKDPVIIDSKLTHGLYVFNIENDNWQEPSKQPEKVSEEPESNSKNELAKTRQNQDAIKDWSKDNENDSQNALAIDSLWNEFAHELDEKWEELNIEMEVDSLGASFKELWGEIDKVDFSDNPDVQEFKSDIKEFFKDLKKTQFIIIHEEDTIEWK